MRVFACAFKHCRSAQIGFNMLMQRGHSSSFTKIGWGKYDVWACVFSVFRAFSILNGYVKSVQMEQARNPDSETLVKKYNRTSGTDLS